MAIEADIELPFVGCPHHRQQAESALLDAKQNLLPVLDLLEQAYQATVRGEPSGQAAERVYRMIEALGWLGVMINTWREMYPIVEVSSRQ